MLSEINDSIKHHAEISAVLGLIKQLDADPDAMELINSYPQTVRAAAMLHYVNTLGSALQHAQDDLARIHKHYGSTAQVTTSAQQDVDSIRHKLDAAVAASKQMHNL